MNAVFNEILNYEDIDGVWVDENQTLWYFSDRQVYCDGIKFGNIREENQLFFVNEICFYPRTCGEELLIFKNKTFLNINSHQPTQHRLRILRIKSKISYVVSKFAIGLRLRSEHRLIRNA